MTDKLPVNIIWHLHQPLYRRAGETTFSLPWVRLHTIREYHDMAEMVERHPEVSVCFNWSPVLLQQIEEYTNGYTDRMRQLREKPAPDLDPGEQYQLVRGALRANPETMIQPYPDLADLKAKWEQDSRDSSDSGELNWSDQEIRDCQVWSTLMWFGFSAVEEYPEITELRDKGSEFSGEDKDSLAEIESRLMGSVIDRWRKLVKETAIEISVNPYFHPIGPLLADYSDVEQAMPDVPQPERRIQWPDDVTWHLEEAKQAASKYFDLDEVGLWPSEGSVSDSFLKLVDDVGFKWTATSEAQLNRLDSNRSHFQAHSWQGKIPVFFRDTRLSDLIGFDYSDQPPESAVGNLTDRLNEIRSSTADNRGRLLTLILDGENPWEHYEDAGQKFLDNLYRELTTSNVFEGVTPSNYLESVDRLPELERMPAGSWINGDFNIWAGCSEDVRAWELLSETREALNGWEDLDEETERNCWQALYAAQGSDWFWWYGEPFHSADDEEFDRLFRENLIYIYRQGGHPEPSYLHYPLHSTESPGFDPPRNFISPEIEGRKTHYWEWWGAARIITSRTTGSMARSADRLDVIRCGSDPENLYLLVSFTDKPPGDASCVLELNSSQFRLGPFNQGNGELEETSEEKVVENSSWAYQQVLECSIPLSKMELEPGDYCSLQLKFYQNETLFERFPAREKLSIPLLDKKTEASEWTA